MPRLIDADDLLMDNSWAFYDENGNRNEACIAVENAPTIEAVPVAELPYTVWLTHDVVQVIRCKDCRHAGECHKSVQYAHNEPNTVTIGYSPIEWCSRGERKEDA